MEMLCCDRCGRIRRLGDDAQYYDMSAQRRGNENVVQFSLCKDCWAKFKLGFTSFGESPLYANRDATKALMKQACGPWQQNVRWDDDQQDPDPPH